MSHQFITVIEITDIKHTTVLNFITKKSKITKKLII